MSTDSLITLDRIRVDYYSGGLLDRVRGRTKPVRAVDDVSMTISRGEAVGLVGESGAGKTTIGRAVLHLAPIASGQLRFNGRDMTAPSNVAVRELRRSCQFIYQDSHASLSPRHKIDYLLREAYAVNAVPAGERLPTEELLRLVGLRPQIAKRYPHELSGGQAKRVCIARALALRPMCVIADEPTAGLDVSAAASILNLMSELRQKFGLTYLIITHNLNMISYFADRVAVMYLGQLVELGPTEDVVRSPRHPYTQGLMASISKVDPTKRRAAGARKLEGEMPSPRNPPAGCRFHTRCPYAEDLCRAVSPEREVTADDREVSCHFWREIAASADPYPNLPSAAIGQAPSADPAGGGEDASVSSSLQ